jgi:DNA-binding MarR family transcriptional regulator
MNSTFWKQVGYVKRSTNRAKALELTLTPITPSELGRTMKISLTHASKIIRELHSQKLITCLNNELKVGRIYQITLTGKKVLKTISGIKVFV